MNFIELLLAFLLILILQSPWLWLMWKSQQLQNRLTLRNNLSQQKQYRSLIKDLSETIEVQATLMNQQQNQAMNLLAAKDPMTFQALTVTQKPSSTFSDSETSKTDTQAQEDMDEIIRVRGFLTPDDALYFRMEEGLEVDDRLIGN